MKTEKYRYLRTLLRSVTVLFMVVLIANLAVGVANAVPLLTATKADALLVDNDSDGVADPGDRLRYTTTITNAGTTDATGVTFADTIDTNTTLVGTSLRTTPIARHDSYAATGNVGITVLAGSGVLANDNDPDGQVISILSFGATSANGGSVTVAGDGSFTYLPPPGFEGSDSFSYTVQDPDTNQDPATVFLSVTDMIWFIDNSAGAGDGRLSSPFNTLAAFEAVNGNGGASDPVAGDSIFIYAGSGSYSGGLTLEISQLLVGQGAGASLSTITGITPPTHSNALPVTGGSKPVLENSSGDGITLASSNLVRGLTVGNSSASGLAGTSVGTLTVSEVIVNNATGGGIEIASGTLAVTLESLTSTSSVDEGIDLTGVSGSFAISDGTVSNTGSSAIKIDGNPSLALNVTLTSVSSSGASTGILLQDTTGSFTIAGSGTTDGSGGTLENLNDHGIELINAQGVSISNMNLTNAALTANVATNTATCTDEPNGNNLGCNAPVHMVNTTNINLTNLTINGSEQHGINGNNVNGLTISNTELSNIGDDPKENGMHFINLLGTVTLNNDSIVGSDTRNVLVENNTGTANITVTNSTFNTAAREDGFAVIGGGTANITLNVSDSSFTHNNAAQLKAHAEDSSIVDVNFNGNDFDGDPAVIGNVGLDLAVRDGADLTFEVGTSGIPQTFQPFRGHAINVFAAGGGTASGKVNGNTILGSAFGAGVRVVAQVTDVNGINPSITVEIKDNTISDIQGGLAGIHIEARDGTNGLTGVATIDATVTNNDVVTNGADAAIQVYLSDLNSTANRVCLNATGNATEANGGAFGETDFFFGNDAISGTNSGIAQMQGFATSVSNTWFTVNGNTTTTAPTPLATSLGPISGGTCAAVVFNDNGASFAHNDDGMQVAGVAETGSSSALVLNDLFAAQRAPVAILETAFARFDTAAFKAQTNELANRFTNEFIAAFTVSTAHASGETINLSLGDLDPGQQVVITFDVDVDTTIPANVTEVCNQGLVESTNDVDLVTDDPDTGAASDATCTNVPQADLEVSKGDSVDPVSPGNAYSYSVMVNNNGPSTAQDVVVTDTLPAGVAFVSTSGCTEDPNGVPTCSLGSIANGGSASYTINVTAPSSSGIVTNNASVTSTTHDPELSDNSSSEDTTVESPGPDLQITKDDGGVTAAPGDTITYTLTFTNISNQNATGVVLTETVPANTTFNSGASTGGWVCLPDSSAGSTCTLAIGAVAGNGGGGAANFAVDVDSPVAAGVTQIGNTAEIADDGANGVDPNPGDNSESDSTPLTAAPNLQITKDDGGVTVDPGDTITYSLTFTNTGNQHATGVVLTETVPANTTFNSGTSTAGWACAPDGSAGSTCTFAIGALVGNGAGGAADFAVDVNDPVAAGATQIDNTAQIDDDGANGADPNPGDNSASDSTPLTLPPDLQITKDDGGVTAVPGNTITYTLIFTNISNQNATGVVLTETVPANTTFNSGTSTGGWVCLPNSSAGSTCTLAIGAVVGNGGGGFVAFAVDVDDPVAAGVTQIDNTAEIDDDGTNGADPNPGDNSDSDSTPLTAAPDLQITKHDGGVTADPGDTITYTLTFTNTGNQNATGVVLTETVPANTTFNSGTSSAGWVCAPDSSAGSTCMLAIGAVAGNGGGGAADFAVDVDSPVTAGVTQIDNTAQIDDDGANGADPNPLDNSDSDSTPLNSAPKAEDDSYSATEDITLNVSAPGVLGNDSDADGDSLTAVLDTSTSHGTLTPNSDGSFKYEPDLNYCGPDSFTYHANDGQANSNVATVDIDVVCVDDPPVVTVNVNSQTVQYSDFIADVTISATDVDSASAGLSISHDAFSDLKVDSESCLTSGDGVACTWKLSGQVLVAASTPTVTFTVSDTNSSGTASTLIIVNAEDATVTFDSGNPIAVPVSSPGGDSVLFSLYVNVQEAGEIGSNTAAGDINMANVSITLEPVGPGSPPVTETCATTGAVSAFDYSAVLEVKCDFSGVEVNAYIATALVSGGYYTGSGEDSLVVYDPSLGFTTGGGSFYWPGTDERTTFGYTMKYNKKATKVKGNLVLIRHLPDGSIYRLKSNAINGLALGEDAAFGWASFSGKTTYKAPGWLEPEGNHTFIAYVEDHGEPGSSDRFWIEVRDKDGFVVADLSMALSASGNAVTLLGGNIVVPHENNGKGKN